MLLRRNRKAAPVISMISRDWNDRVTMIEFTDGALVYMDSRNFMVASEWGAKVTWDHWDLAWTEVGRNAVRA